MRRILQYDIFLDTTKSIDLPSNAKCVQFASQNGVLQIRFEVEGTAPTVERRFRVYATGQDIPNGHAHLGTCQQGSFVWHLYEVA